MSQTTDIAPATHALILAHYERAVVNNGRFHAGNSADRLAVGNVFAQAAAPLAQQRFANTRHVS